MFFYCILSCFTSRDVTTVLAVAVFTAHSLSEAVAVQLETLRMLTITFSSDVGWNSTLSGKQPS